MLADGIRGATGLTGKRESPAVAGHGGDDVWRRRINSREGKPPRDARRKPARVGGQRSAKPGSELRRSPLPADLLRALDNEHASPGLAERRRGNEAVGPRADDDRVENGNGRHETICIAASRPDAPMMPPPGCVPA